MGNPNYVKGRRKEYRVVNSEKERGCLAFRSAGSHSPVDVVSIDSEHKLIKLIQCKPDNYKQIGKLMKENKDLNGIYSVVFVVL